MARMARDRPVGQYGDEVLRLQQKVYELEQRVLELTRNSRPTIPAYNPSFLNAMSDTGLNDGEYWINSNNEQMYYIFNGHTYKITAT